MTAITTPGTLEETNEVKDAAILRRGPLLLEEKYFLGARIYFPRNKAQKIIALRRKEKLVSLLLDAVS